VKEGLKQVKKLSDVETAKLAKQHFRPHEMIEMNFIDSI
jgi:hypothetical protein